LNLTDQKNRLVEAVFGIAAVKAVGQSGDIDEIPQPGKGDIDLFILCDAIPDERERRAAYATCPQDFSESRMNCCEGGYWGTGDMLLVAGVEAYFMYFTVAEMRRYIADVLDGRYPDSDAGFYPTGRLATIDTIHVLRDEGDTFASLKAMVREYPDTLSRSLFSHHFERIIDEEDFGRAVSRRDVLFYHMVLENSIDHFLQALYALNKDYFPSRKRTEQHMAAFARIPRDCHARMLEVVADGSHGESLARSVRAWRALVDELGTLAGIEQEN